MARRSKLAFKNPWSAPTITRAQQKMLRRNGVNLSMKCAIVRNPSLQVWCDTRGGGRDRKILNSDQRRALVDAEGEWNR